MSSEEIKAYREFWAAWSREFGPTGDAERNYHEAAVAYDRDPDYQPDPEPVQVDTNDDEEEDDDED